MEVFIFRGFVCTESSFSNREVRSEIVSSFPEVVASSEPLVSSVLASDFVCSDGQYVCAWNVNSCMLCVVMARSNFLRSSSSCDFCCHKRCYRVLGKLISSSAAGDFR